MFLDRDGVLAVPEFRNGRSYAVTRLEDFRLYDDASEALARLKNAGYVLVVVTNQPDVGNGKVALETVEAMHEQMCAALPVDAVYACYHRSEERCDCRKPKPGMLLAGQADWSIDLSASFMVGDRASDIAAGHAVGCRSVFIDLDYSAEGKPDEAEHRCGDLGSAADWILAQTSAVPRLSEPRA
ncbi:MAG: HAD family hydrolase [Pseudomonadota bacterium]